MLQNIAGVPEKSDWGAENECRQGGGTLGDDEGLAMRTSEGEHFRWGQLVQRHCGGNKLGLLKKAGPA